MQEIDPDTHATKNISFKEFIMHATIEGRAAYTKYNTRYEESVKITHDTSGALVADKPDELVFDATASYCDDNTVPVRIGHNADSYDRWLKRLTLMSEGGNKWKKKPIDTMFAQRTDFMLAPFKLSGVRETALVEAKIIGAIDDRRSSLQQAVETTHVPTVNEYNASQLEKMRPLFNDLAEKMGTEIGTSSLKHFRR